jgi:hypothetical protein
MHHDPASDILRQASEHVKHRAIYYAARIIVLGLLASIMFFPHMLTLFFGNLIVLLATILGTVILALTLFADLLFEKQENVGSLIFKYLFLTLSVILAYGLFYYVNATQIEPPGIHYMQGLGGEKDVERDVFYLSATTYYTIGYGDMVPLGAYARAAAVSEAFMGNLINLIVLAMAFQNLLRIEPKDGMGR